MSVARKIHEVMSKVDKIQSSKMAFGKTNYDYIAESELTKEIRVAMIEVGLVVIPRSGFGQTSKGGRDSDLTLTDVNVNYRIVDIDAETMVEGLDYVDVCGLGQGIDSADKAMSKAMTAAYKVMQRQVFMIPSPSKDDPDTTASDAYTAPARTASKPAEVPPSDGKHYVKNGKMAGKALEDLINSDVGYVRWVANQSGHELSDVAKGLLAKLG